MSRKTFSKRRGHALAEQTPRQKQIEDAFTELSDFLEWATDDKFLDKCRALRLADDSGILAVLRIDTDKLLYTFSIDELLQAHGNKAEWTRLLSKIGDWIRDVFVHHCGARKRKEGAVSVVGGRK